MPNHIKNKLVIDASFETLDAILNEFGTNVKPSLKTASDNSLVCMYKDEDFKFCWMDLRTGHVTSRDGINQIGLPDGYSPEIKEGFLHFPDFTKVTPPPDDPAYHDQPSQDVARNSPNWWYNWNVENWGTKCTAYACERIGSNKFMFETAWSPVPEIINKISLKYPGATIHYTWADDDTGSNCGKQVYRNGLIDEVIPKNRTLKAFEIAFELRPYEADNYKLVDGKYVCFEEE